MENPEHGGADRIVMGVEWGWVLGATAGSERLGGSAERFDRFVAENEESGHGSEVVGKMPVSDGVANPADDLFAPAA
jgi:hypothetical protein